MQAEGTESARNNTRVDALRLAASFGSVDTVKTLLEAGADVNTQSSYGCTALHYAAWDGHVDVLHALLLAGADIDMQNANGSTALYLAAWNGRVECLKALVHAGAAMDGQSMFGDTALEFSKRENNYTACIDVLTSFSARRTNVLARVVRFAVFEDSYDAAGMATAGLYFEDASERLYESLLKCVLLAVESRLSLAECRLVSKAWRRGCDNTLFERPVEFFASKTAACP
jgi:hypothetical protein